MNVVGLIVFAVVVLVLETVGGMNSVVLSDAIQALLMVFGFIAVFLVVSSTYGSLSALSPANCDSLCYVNTTSRSLLTDAKDFDTSPDQCRSGDTCVDGANCTQYGAPHLFHPASRWDREASPPATTSGSFSICSLPET